MANTAGTIIITQRRVKHNYLTMILQRYWAKEPAASSRQRVTDTRYPRWYIVARADVHLPRLCISPKILTYHDIICKTAIPYLSSDSNLYGDNPIEEVPLQLCELGSSGRCAVQVFCFLLGSRYGRRPNPTPNINPTLTLTSNRSQTGPKLVINAAAPRYDRTRNVLNNSRRRFRSADHATQFSSQKHP